jgi:hypothetical protein
MAIESSHHDELAEENIPPPRGTVFVLGLYLLALMVGWFVMFLMLMGR